MTPAHAPLSKVGRARTPRPWLDFVFAFVCIFAGLSLPLPGVESNYLGVQRALCSAILPSSLPSGVGLSLLQSAPGGQNAAWSLTLLVEPPAPQAPITVPMDLRTLLYLPTACFVALALATPGASLRRRCALLLRGLLILEPLLLGLLALPVISLLGGTGPVRAFSLGLGAHTVLQIVYRALVASPGMTYVIPLVLWWQLAARADLVPKFERGVRNSKSRHSATQP